MPTYSKSTESLSDEVIEVLKARAGDRDLSDVVNDLLADELPRMLTEVLHWAAGVARKPLEVGTHEVTVPAIQRPRQRSSISPVSAPSVPARPRQHSMPIHEGA